MNKYIKSSLTVLVVCLMAFALSFGCFADTTVTYTGNSGDFIFASNSKDNPTDLFENFKDVMPGDVLTQNIVVKNDADKQVDVEVFLKSLGADDESKSLLEKLEISVKAVDGDVLSTGNAAETAKLSDWVSLGKIASGGKATLEVTLSVPKDLSNDYADALGKLQWQFKVEEKPVEVPTPTSDTSMIFLFCGIFTVAFATGILLVVYKRKKQV